MSLPRLLSLIAAMSLLGLCAPAAHASELVKLARLIVTGKRIPTVAPADKPAQATPPALVKAEPVLGGESRSTPASASAEDLSEPPVDSPAPRTEPNRSERVGQGPQRGNVG